MYKEAGKIIYSPTDITTYMSSPFASWMNRFRIDSPENAPSIDEDDALNLSLSKRGLDHEENLLSELGNHGKTIASITEEKLGKNASFEKKNTATIDAMAAGYDVVFQAALELSSFRGYADFLIKVPGESKFGDYHYEVWDTKLASKVKPYFVIQLCCYAEMLEQIQGVRPKNIVVALGNGNNETLNTENYFYYYLSLKEQFLSSQKLFNPNLTPNPADSKSYGRWSNYAEQILEEKDHLSLIANITRSQVKKLNQAGVITCDELIKLKDIKIPGLNESILKSLKAQATIQNESNG